MSDDLIRITVSDGKYTFAQRKDGSCHALRYGVPWKEDIFDGLTLSMAYRIEELEAKHTELVSAVKDLLHDVRLSILDEELSDSEGYELWEEVKKFRRVIHAAGLAELKGQDR